MEEHTTEPDGYEDFIITCVRQLKLSIREIEELDVYTFSLLMIAHRLQEEDEEYMNARLAWMLNRSEDTTDSGKRKYKKFSDFYDYEKRVKTLSKPPVKSKPMKRLALLSKEINLGGE